MTTDTRPIFFVHIMKTGGTTFKQIFLDSFGDGEIYPNGRDDTSALTAVTDISYLRAISAERLQRTRVFMGHFPYIASEFVGTPVRTMTMLRHPVDRVISHIRQLRRGDSGWRRMSGLKDVESPSLEAVYDDEFLKSVFLLNHQARMFAMTAEDDPKSYTDLIDMHEGRLETACRHLERIEGLGILEDFDNFLADACTRFDLSTRSVEAQHVSTDKSPASEELRERIAHENALDMAFYEHARALVEARGGETA